MSEKRPPGRPPLDRTDASTRVSVRLTGKHYDDLYRRAQDARVPLADYIRTQLQPKH